jgi:hypothetical protein
MAEGRRRELLTREDIMEDNKRMLIGCCVSLLPFLIVVFAVPYILTSTVCPSAPRPLEVRMASGLASTQYCAYASPTSDMTRDNPQLNQAKLCGADRADVQQRASSAVSRMRVQEASCRESVRSFYNIGTWFR